MCSELQLEAEATSSSSSSSSLQVANAGHGTRCATRETERPFDGQPTTNRTTTPPDYNSVAKEECLSIPVAKTEYSDQPPSYQSLFGKAGISSNCVQLHPSASLCHHHHPLRFHPEGPHPVRPPPSLTCIQVSRTLPRRGRRKWERCCQVFTQAAKKNKAITTLYLVFFVIGMVLPLSMLIVGGAFSREMDHKSSVLVLMWTGTSLLAFVLWHVCVHLMGLYLKSKDARATIYWTLRFCHCGYCFWDIVLVYFSIIFWSQLDPQNDLDFLTGLVIGSLVCQYVIVLCCIVEMIVDAQIHFPTQHFL